MLEILLKDNTTGKNIKWFTDNYEKLGYGYNFFDSIKKELITVNRGDVIKPRVEKTTEEKKIRIKDKAEVFTPSWICNSQSNLIDNEWFEYKGAFNTEIKDSKKWKVSTKKVKFINGKTWEDYVLSKRLEITCGEAPYLVSRYDSVTGKTIKLKERIGILDRKIRVINENVKNDEEWNEWIIKAFKSVYGYEWQGDNLLLARENLLYTFKDYYFDRYGEDPDVEFQIEIAKIISWNLWQMDGIKFVVPMSCKTITREENDNLYTLMGEEKKIITEECIGCKKDKIKKHNGIYCYIMDWDKNKGKGKKIKFLKLMGK